MSRSPAGPRPRFKVFHSVDELGLGARIARTRRRLLLVTGGVTGLLVAYAIGTTGFMRAQSTSVGLNVFLISGAMLFVLVTAFVQGLAVGDLCFPGQWRERVILGRPAAEEADDAVSIDEFKDHSALFYVVVVGLLVGNFLLYGLVSGGFLSEYHAWGYQQTLLRSGNADDELRGIRNLVNPRNRDAQDADPVRAELVELTRTATSEVRGWALWAIRELHLFEAAPTLRALVADESLDESLRARAAEALGSLSDPDGAALLARLLGDSFGRDELAMGLLRGLGLAQVESTAPAIEEMLHVDPYDVRGHAYWALGRTGNRRYHGLLVEQLEDGTDEERCLAAEALKFLANEDDRVAAHTWFATAPDLECAPVVWELPYHWSDEYSFRTDIVVGESLSAKCLKIVFTSGGTRERDFFATIALDPERPDELRSLARELALRIDHRR